MPKTTKIAISMLETLLQDIEKERLACGQTRSEFVRRAVQAFLRRQREREWDEQYVRGYLEYPETPEEVEGFYLAGLAALAENPWDDSEYIVNLDTINTVAKDRLERMITSLGADKLQAIEAAILYALGLET